MGNKTLYAVYDIGGHGMSDRGLLGIYDSYEKALLSVNGDNYYPIKEFELNTKYKDGITSIKSIIK
jgi:hypothetical protein